ncbi:unnamed protein product [Allacma fusca]|uniref:BHLH domain-containing protein n=1 Tax=Allacma fusca TaxID=39272 RepID=A0A8J2J141_9HEXA|nr:unnamed protein product [Allacma fusca]
MEYHSEYYHSPEIARNPCQRPHSSHIIYDDSMSPVLSRITVPEHELKERKFHPQGLSSSFQGIENRSVRTTPPSSMMCDQMMQSREDSEIASITSSTSNSGRPYRRTRRKSPTLILKLKKHRREKANDRERHRMHLLNDALERLRLALPSMPQDQRLTKIESLRFAHNYIWALSQAVSLINFLASPNSHGEAPMFFNMMGNKEDSSSCGVEFQDGNYVVRVGNVKIVVDKEGKLVETVATRPSTPTQTDQFEHGHREGVNFGAALEAHGMISSTTPQPQSISFHDHDTCRTGDQHVPAGRHYTAHHCSNNETDGSNYSFSSSYEDEPIDCMENNYCK